MPSLMTDLRRRLDQEANDFILHDCRGASYLVARLLILMDGVTPEELGGVLPLVEAMRQDRLRLHNAMSHAMDIIGHFAEGKPVSEKQWKAVYYALGGRE